MSESNEPHGIDGLARSLGWLSIGLGVIELLAPNAIARGLGLQGKTPRLRAFGARELIAGVLTLSVDKQTGLWSRVAGDALDIMTVLPALSRQNSKRGRAALALLALGVVAAIDAVAAQAVSAKNAEERGYSRHDRSVPSEKDAMGQVPS